MKFKPNRKFKRDYDRMFKKNPEAANLFLMLSEIADEGGQIITNEPELSRMMSARFKNPRAYSLGSSEDD